MQVKLAQLTVLLLALSLVAPALPVGAEGGTDPWLFDGFEDGDIEASSGLSWVVLADDQFGGTSEGHLEVVDGGAGGSAKALRFHGQKTDEAQMSVVGAWVAVQEVGHAKDLSAFRGIRFYARSVAEAQPVAVGMRRGMGRPMNYTKAFTATGEWTRVEVLFTDLEQSAQGGAAVEWSAKDVSWLGFNIAPDYLGEFNIEVDEIELY